MPLDTRYLETAQVIRLTHHFLEEKKQAGVFTEYQIYSQTGARSPRFGDSAVIAVARRSHGQLPVVFACDGQPDDTKRKEEKEPWKFSDIPFAAMREWVQAEEKTSNFDLHISLRKGSHWTVYIFKFRGAQQAVLQQLFEMQEKHSKKPRPREPTDRGNGCGFIQRERMINDATIAALSHSTYILVGEELFHIDKRPVTLHNLKPGGKICPYKIPDITPDKIRAIREEFKKLPIRYLSEDQMLAVTRITRHVHGEGRVDEGLYTLQQNQQKQKINGLLGQLYQTVTVSYIDPKKWSVPIEIQTDIRNVFKKQALAISRLTCPYQQDGYTCGERSARNTVLAACTEGNIHYEQGQDTYNLRLQAMAVLGIPLVKNSDFFNGYYVLLRFVGVVLISLILGYFLSAAALVTVGGFWGMLGIALGGWLLCEIGNWLMRPEMKEGEQEQYDSFKPIEKASPNPVNAEDLLSAGVGLGQVPVSGIPSQLSVNLPIAPNSSL